MALLESLPEHAHRRTCMLMVTHACNLACSYCYEAHKGERYMTLGMAKKLLRAEFRMVKSSGGKFRELNVEFMGGEPLMNFKLIKAVIEWLEVTDFGVPWIASCTTNGTLLTAEKKSWFMKHRDRIVLCLSYDGDGEMQETNRGSHQIDTEFFKRTWPGQRFHMTISRETLPHLAHGILDIQRRGIGLEASLAQGVEWTGDDAEEYLRQLRMLSEAYLEDETLQPIGLLARSLGGIRRDASAQKKYCGTGSHMVAYDIDGKAYPCHMFTTVVLGEKALPQEKSGLADNCILTDESCSGCLFANWCPTCCGFNYRLRGDLARRDHNWCGMIRSNAIVACEFQIAYYNRRQRELSEDDMSQVKAVLQTYDVLTKGE